MGAETYPDAAVRESFPKHVVPFKLNILKDRDLARRLRPLWTPGFLYLAPDGTELLRELGYLPPKEFVPRTLVSAGLCYFQTKQTDRAVACFEEAEKSYPDSYAAPEARYFRGVCLTRRAKDARHIHEAAKEILERWPDSIWATKLGFTPKYKDFNLDPFEF